MLTESVSLALAVALLQSGALFIVECDFQESARRADRLPYFCQSAYLKKRIVRFKLVTGKKRDPPWVGFAK